MAFRASRVSSSRTSDAILVPPIWRSTALACASAPRRVAALERLGVFGAAWSMRRGSAHTASHWLHSRAAFVASHLDGAGDAVAAHKAAAVAASTLALAGGGAATVATLPHGSGHPAHAGHERGQPAARVARPATGASALP